MGKKNKKSTQIRITFVEMSKYDIGLSGEYTGHTSDFNLVASYLNDHHTPIHDK